MTDMQAAPVQGTAPLSTSIDQGGAPIGGTGGGAVPLTSEPKAEAPAKPESAGDTLKGELARIREQEAKEAEKVKGQGEEAAKGAKEKLDEAEKAKPDAKQPEPDKAKAEAPAKADEPADKADKSAAEKPATGQEAADKSRQSEGRQHQEPPARFLPEARTKWGNVPNEVKAEVHRVAQEYESEIAKGKQATERYEPLRQFDEIAQKNGRELKDSLAKVVQIETALARSPVIGLEMILREIGPRKADGSPVSLYEIAQVIAKQTPQQFAQNMQGAIPQARQQQPQVAPPQVKALEDRIAGLESRLMASAGQPIIDAFRASHTDYDALEQQIAAILKSKVIDQIYGTGLSPAQKLEQAYRMAGGQTPSRSEPEPAPAHSAAAADRPVDPDGTKSIRGAPNGGKDPDDDGDDETDIRKLLQREARKLAS